MDKYIEMKIRTNEYHANSFTDGREQPNSCNVTHPYMESNCSSTTRIWLDLMLKRPLKWCVDWSKIDKNDYLAAVRKNVTDSTHIEALVLPALTTKIDDGEMFMKGIDYSYYYEQNEWSMISLGVHRTTMLFRRIILMLKERVEEGLLQLWRV